MGRDAWHVQEAKYGNQINVPVLKTNIFWDKYVFPVDKMSSGMDKNARIMAALCGSNSLLI